MVVHFLNNADDPERSKELKEEKATTEHVKKSEFDEQTKINEIRFQSLAIEKKALMEDVSRLEKEQTQKKEAAAATESKKLFWVLNWSS